MVASLWILPGSGLSNLPSWPEVPSNDPGSGAQRQSRARAGGGVLCSVP